MSELYSRYVVKDIRYTRVVAYRNRWYLPQRQISKVPFANKQHSSYLSSWGNLYSVSDRIQQALLGQEVGSDHVHTYLPSNIPTRSFLHVFSRTSKGGPHRFSWCALLSQARVVMWTLWDALLTLVRPLRRLMRSGGGSSTITLQNGTRYAIIYQCTFDDRTSLLIPPLLPSDRSLQSVIR